MRLRTLLGLLVLVVTAVVVLSSYFSGQSLNACLGLGAVVLSIGTDRGDRGRARFGWVALACAALAWWLPLYTTKYMALAFAALYWIERQEGRIGNLVPVSALLLMMPVFSNLANVFSFPIRLSLTNVAGKVLKAGVSGNTLTYGGADFSVDPECMGLHMLIASGLGGLMLVGVHQKRERKTLRLGALLVVGGLALGANLVSNLARIIAVVFFQVMPGTWMHEALGLLCFALYGMLPLAVVTGWMVRRYGKTPGRRPATRRFRLEWALLLVAVCSATIPQKSDSQSKVSAWTPPGFQRRVLPDGIVQLSSPGALWYVKPIPGFLYAEHHPLLCWTGGGYQVEQVREEAGVYMAVLVRQKERLYTAWWYDNGTRMTISQLSWRWDVCMGAPGYAIINLTASTPGGLAKALAYCLRPEIRQRLLRQ